MRDFFLLKAEDQALSQVVKSALRSVSICRHSSLLSGDRREFHTDSAGLPPGDETQLGRPQNSRRLRDLLPRHNLYLWINRGEVATLLVLVFFEALLFCLQLFLVKEP